MSFLFTVLQPNDPYRDRWLTFRSGWRTALLAFCGLPVTLVASIVLLNWNVRPLLAALPIAVNFLLAQFLGWRASQFSCPRCGRRFRNWSYYLHSSDNCQHCGLPEYSPNDLHG